VIKKYEVKSVFGTNLYDYYAPKIKNSVLTKVLKNSFGYGFIIRDVIDAKTKLEFNI